MNERGKRNRITSLYFSKLFHRKLLLVRVPILASLWEGFNILSNEIYFDKGLWWEILEVMIFVR